MRIASHSLIVATPLAVVFAAAAPFASADITGFNNLSGWTYNQAPSDFGTPADLPDPDRIHLTNLGTAQARSIFYNTRQSIMGFVASFSYQALNADASCDYGATFTIQNDPRGRNALGSTGGGIGYAGNSTSSVHISNSVAVTLQLSSGTTGFWTNGQSGSSLPTGDVFLRSGNPIDVTLTYNGNILTERLVDTVTLQEYSRNLIVGDLSNILGSSTAYIGFTASTTSGQCSGVAADQYISGFEFHVIPSPATLPVMLAAFGIGALRRRRM